MKIAFYEGHAHSDILVFSGIKNHRTYRFHVVSCLKKHDVLANYLACFARSRLWIFRLTKMKKKTQCIIQLSSSLTVTSSLSIRLDS